MFPHSDTRGSLLICSSPRLFAAYRVFLRLLVPRHPSCALSDLTFSSLPLAYGRAVSFFSAVSIQNPSASSVTQPAHFKFCFAKARAAFPVLLFGTPSAPCASGCSEIVLFLSSGLPDLMSQLIYLLIYVFHSVFCCQCALYNKSHRFRFAHY